MEILKFKSILKQKVWGGEKIKIFKQLDTNKTKIGESWEISDIEGNKSIIENEAYKALSLSELLKLQKEHLIGKSVYNKYHEDFPLLIKFIDAAQDLSIQVHPDDSKAQKRGYPFGKTEMWYVIKADKDASLLVGFKNDTTKEEIQKAIIEGNICEKIKRYPVKEGDCFFIPAGRIHAICSGCLIAEIQQSSDITYRTFDYNRLDLNGKQRELHVNESLECFNYKAEKDYQTHYNKIENKATPLVDCEYFTTQFYEINQKINIDYSKTDSFVILMATKGTAQVTNNENFTVSIKQGETILIPADNEEIIITPTSEKINILETFIRQ